MKTTNKWFFLLSMFAISGCQDNTCHVQGKLSGFPGETTVYMLRRTGEFTRDTLMQTEMKNGKFQLNIPQEMWGEQYELKFGDTRSLLSFFAEQGNVRISGDINAIYNASVTGTPANESWNNYLEYSTKINQLRNTESGKIRQSNQPDSVKRILFDQLFRETDEAIERYKDSLAQAEPNSVVSLYLYYQTLPLMKHEQIDQILARFSPQLETSRYYQEMKKQADLLRKVAPGVMAPDFEVYTTDGGKVKLSSFRGKYLVLDFWASWCAPCREETVYIKEIYDKFHDSGLEVFSVSLDDNKEAWLKAIQEDGMTWHHGCQLVKGGATTPVAKLYGINGIPAIWVIDPNGKILAEGLQKEALVEFCSNLFQK